MASVELPKEDLSKPQNPKKSTLKSETKEKIPKDVKTTPKKSKENKVTTLDQSKEIPEDKKSLQKPVKKLSKSPPSKQEANEGAGAQKKKPTKSQKARSSPTQGRNHTRPSTPDGPSGGKPNGVSEEPATTKVKQFSFPGYKILSGASVAPVKMYPQKIVIKRGEDEPPESAPKRWAEGLFHGTTMSLKVRLLRWLMIWLFFRVLNKQTSWLAQKMGVGAPAQEDPGMKPPKGEPGERYIRVFHDAAPHPFHVKVKDGKINMEKPAG